MMVPVAGAMAKDVLLVRPDLEPPVLVACQGCASPWPPVSSCSSKSRTTGRQHHHLDALMALLLPHAAVRLLLELRQLLLFHVLQPLPQQHRGVQASDLAQELVVSADLDGLTGTTAQNWKRFAVSHHKNSVKRSTSLVKTMMP
jgi:hypothetical protein